MKQITCRCGLALLVLVLIVPWTKAGNLTKGMTEGKPVFQSMGPLAFGPEGILFVADTKAAAIVAIATGDTAPASGTRLLKVEGVNQKIAALLGTTADQLLIEDMVVNPLSRSAYLAVSRGRGPDAIPLLIRVKADNQPEVLVLDKVKFSRAELPDAPVDGVVNQGNRQSNPPARIDYRHRIPGRPSLNRGSVERGIFFNIASHTISIQNRRQWD